MDWSTVDKATNPNNSYCSEKIKPSYNELQQFTQDVVGEEFQESTHPWCKSCYGLYSQVCETIAKHFNIPSHQTKLDRWKISDLQEAISNHMNRLSDEPAIVIIRDLNPLLQILCDCIKLRHYHHGKCYFHKDRTNNSLQKPNILHMQVISKLCQCLAELLELYKMAKDLYMFGKKQCLPSDVIDFSRSEEQVFNICRHQIEKYSKAKYIDLLCTTTPKPQHKLRNSRSRSPDRDKELVKSGYEIKASYIENLRLSNQYKNKYNDTIYPEI
jgi:hypothetical protein